MGVTQCDHVWLLWSLPCFLLDYLFIIDTDLTDHGHQQPVQLRWDLTWYIWDWQPWGYWGLIALKCTEIFVQVTGAAELAFGGPLYNKTPYHTSALSGLDWVLELINGHPEHIQNELEVHKHIFGALLDHLRALGHHEISLSRNNWQYFFVHVSLVYLSDTSARDSSMQQIQHPGKSPSHPWSYTHQAMHAITFLRC